jgi:hypothetical protein
MHVHAGEILGSAVDVAPEGRCGSRVTSDRVQGPRRPRHRGRRSAWLMAIRHRDVIYSSRVRELKNIL